jgi:exodeoxyribonuclease VII large subunit
LRKDASEAAGAEIRSWPISKYLQSVKRLLASQVPRLWVHGVVSQINERGKAVYITLAEYAPGDVRPQATLQLLVWASDYAVLRQKLEIEPELKVRFFVESDFWVPSGSFRAHILDIDPAYTLGELALTRQAILARLTAEGLLRKNAEKPFPLLPLRVGLVSAEASAAYQDFCSTLAASGFPFQVLFAGARMQGAETEATVLAALGRLRACAGLDAVCVVRGGGGKADLNYFDSEALCRAVADFPVPVLTGIGHEIDSALLDLVAWQKCITPTDCAKVLVARAEAARLRAFVAVGEVGRLARLRLQGEHSRLALCARSLSRVPACFERERERARRNADGLRLGVGKIVAYQKMSLELLAEKVMARDPARQLERGFSLSFDSAGRLLRSARGAQAGERISTRFADGVLESVDC